LLGIKVAGPHFGVGVGLFRGGRVNKDVIFVWCGMMLVGFFTRFDVRG